MKRWSIALALLAVACGPSVTDGNGNGTGADGGNQTPGPDADWGDTATVTGTVWAPGNAPGMVPAGQEIPIFDALVYVSPSKPPPIPQETYCERCVSPPGNAVFTDHDGHFMLPRLVANTYWLVIQKGQFRLEQQITLTGNEVLTLPAAQTTLPSELDPDGGKWVPRIAMAVGSYDNLEDILGKMGIGEVDGLGRFVPQSAPGSMDIYANGDALIDSVAVGDLSALVGDLGRMLEYHIIFIPCSGTLNTAALQNQDNLRNIREYVAAGGKLYVTDWSGEWHDNVFPAQVELGGIGTDTPASAYNPGSGTWNTAQFGNADGSAYDSNDGEAVDDDLHTWLHGQQGPTAFDASQSTYDASRFTVEGNWNTIENLEMVQVGTDDEGFPLYDIPKAWLIGSAPGSTKKPLTVTYEPAGCGRVLFSTYHTTHDTHVGLAPQERVLLYLIMEIGVCTSGPVVD